MSFFKNFLLRFYVEALRLKPSRLQQLSDLMPPNVGLSWRPSYTQVFSTDVRGNIRVTHVSWFAWDFPSFSTKSPVPRDTPGQTGGVSPWEAPVVFGAGDADFNQFPLLVLIEPTDWPGRYSQNKTKQKNSVPCTAEEHL